MVIYSTFNHPTCKEVLSQIDAIADIDLILVKPRKNFKDNTVYYPIENEIIDRADDVPVLIDKDKIIIGLEIIDYLASNPETRKFLIKEIIS